MAELTRIYIASHPADAEMFKDLLATRGIEAVIQGEMLFGARGEAPLTPESLPSVWVHAEDAAGARALAEKYQRREPLDTAAATPWRCPRCGENIEPQFTQCWNCQTPRPDA